MFVRKSLTGALTAALAGSALVLSAGAAHAVYTADPDDTTFVPVAANVLGVGSDTSQNALFRLATAYNAKSPAPANKLATYAATSAGTIPLPTAEINRPNGSGSGKATLFNPSNPDVDFARSSSTLSDPEIAAGLQQFPFALDTLKMAVSGQVASHAPLGLTVAQIVSIYKGDVTNWSQIGGTAGVIVPMIPQGGSGTRGFFEAQLKAANAGTAVTLAGTVVSVQEHDPAPIQGNADAVAPFSAGRAGLAGTALRLETGFAADRALYNVVRGGALADADIQAIFGQGGFVCSDGARDEILAAGFKQLDRPENEGVCGLPTQAAATNFATNDPVVTIATTTTLSASNPSARALRLVATVAGSSTPTGTVKFTSGETVLGTANLIGGTATLNLTGVTPGTISVTATYAPTEGSNFLASTGDAVASVKTSSTIAETFASIVKGAAKAKGVVTVTLADTATKATGKVTLKDGSKTVGTGTLSGGKITITLTKAKLGSGKSTVKISYPGSTTAFGSTKSFTITFK